jgi:hypothetical protein
MFVCYVFWVCGMSDGLHVLASMHGAQFKLRSMMNSNKNKNNQLIVNLGFFQCVNYTVVAITTS